MPNFLEHVGLGQFLESEKDTMALAAFAVENGEPVIGYYGMPYINHHIGDAQLILRTKIDEDSKKIEVVGFDTHADGNAKWKVRISGINIDDGTDQLSKKVMVSQEDGGGMAVVNIVNADILPSFAEDEIYTLQMIAFPVDIKYYASAEDYENEGAIDSDGKRWLLGEGSVIPIGFMSNHMVRKNVEVSEEKNGDSESDDIVAIRGRVKKLYHGILETGEKEPIKAYIRCIIDTEFGELEIDHSYETVEENDRSNIKVGATVVAMAVLSGDAANYEYAHGIVKNEENNLRLMRYTFINGDPERLRLVLSEDAEYTLDSNGKTYKGKDEIIARLKYVHENGSHEYYAYMATIISVDDTGTDEPVYPIGTRCVVLSSEDRNSYESIAFVTTDSDGNIKKIYTCMDSKYHFKIDELPKMERDLSMPQSYKESMIIRATFHNFTDEETMDMIRGICISENDTNAVASIMSLKAESIELTDMEVAENVFGYVFAKAIEKSACNELRLVKCSEYSSQAFEGILNTEADGVLRDKLHYSWKYGKQFYKDYSNYTHDERDYLTGLQEALTYVHALGTACASYFLRELSAE